MGQFINVEIEPANIVETMLDDGNFQLAMYQEMAQAIEAGAMADDAGDIGGSLSKDEAEFLSNQFHALGEAIRFGFNMTTHGETIA
jgi:hypothetical protein